LYALDIMHRIKHDHPFGHFRGVIAEFAALRIASPDFEGGCFHNE
jgi:hypothetical protein